MSRFIALLRQIVGVSPTSSQEKEARKSDILAWQLLNPAERWRMTILDGMKLYTSQRKYEANDFLDFLDGRYLADKQYMADYEKFGLPEAEKQKIAEAIARGQSKPDYVKATQLEIFILAIGLLTYGRLDVTDDILDSASFTGKVRRLAYCLSDVIPLPENLDPLSHQQAIRVWLAENRSRLLWNEEAGKFVFNEG